MKRVLLKLSYDGTFYRGWQKQADLKTVQAEVEKALFVAFKKNIEVFASGRTDAGVHAIGQCVHFDIDDTVPVRKIKMILNRILPNDIEIISAKKVPNNFHARFSVKSKTYIYKIYNQQKNCFLANKVAFVKEYLDINNVQKYLWGNIILRVFVQAILMQKILKKLYTIFQFLKRKILFMLKLQEVDF